jgi:quercetin dioxygenase-like cupin family protein
MHTLHSYYGIETTRKLRLHQKKEPVAINTSLSALSPETTFVGRAFNLGNHSARCVADAAMTGGAFSMFEVIAEPGGGTPPHSHQNEDETFYVLEGALAVMEEGDLKIITANQCAFAGRGKMHAWQSVGETAVRMILTVSPGGFESFFHELEGIFSSPGDQTPGAKGPGPELIARVNAAMARFDITPALPDAVK